MTLRRPAAPACFWITGFSGAGKTTVAEGLAARFRAAGITPVLLDGDRLRAVLAPEAGHDPETRRRLAATYGRLCAELAGQGLVVICATISMFQAVRDWNRAHVPGYVEIYLKVPVAERRARDPKGLYAAADGQMTGLDHAAEEPLTPDLVLENHGTLDAEAAVAQIWEKFVVVRHG